MGDGNSDAAWDYVDFEEVEWLAAGIVSGGYLVFRHEDGTEVGREWYPCPNGDDIAIINATLRQIYGGRYHGRDA